MSDELVEVPFEGKAGDKATLLLAAAEEGGHDPRLVQTTTGAFLVPKHLADKAFGESEDEDSEGKKTAKKAAAKKSTTEKPQE